jgi:hypothetical protein
MSTAVHDYMSLNSRTEMYSKLTPDLNFKTYIRIPYCFSGLGENGFSIYQFSIIPN